MRVPAAAHRDIAYRGKFCAFWDRFQDAGSDTYKDTYLLIRSVVSAW